jgi:hypothetical protein
MTSATLDRELELITDLAKSAPEQAKEYGVVRILVVSQQWIDGCHASVLVSMSPDRPGAPNMLTSTEAWHPMPNPIFGSCDGFEPG